MIQGLRTTAIIRAGVQLGVFDHISRGANQPGAIASAIGADERGTRILLDALAALGLLDADGTYRLSPTASAFLVSSSPTYLGGMVDIMAGEILWSAYGQLSEAVRQGGSVLEAHLETHGHPFWETYASSSALIAAPAGHTLAQLLERWAESRSELEVLDVACGSGLHSLIPATRWVDARVTLVDWANVLPVARSNVERLRLVDRTRFIEGDVFKVPLGGPYDLILASHLLHHFSEQRCLELLRRFTPVLSPGGLLVINDFMASASPAANPLPALFSVTMLVQTSEGEVHALTTYERLLQEAGFRSPQVHPSRATPSWFLVTEPREPTQN